LSKEAAVAEVGNLDRYEIPGFTVPKKKMQSEQVNILVFWDPLWGMLPW
jgi:hypothetical protein